MLIDFQDALGINVFLIGAAYIAIARGLFILIPVVDPSLFVSRFCSKLELADKRSSVM